MRRAYELSVYVYLQNMLGIFISWKSRAIRRQKVTKIALITHFILFSGEFSVGDPSSRIHSTTVEQQQQQQRKTESGGLSIVHQFGGKTEQQKKTNENNDEKEKMTQCK